MTHEGNAQVKETKTLALIQKYEAFKMEDDENIEKMFSRFQTLTARLRVKFVKICPKNNQGCVVVQVALQEQMDLGWIQHIRVKTECDVNMVQGCPGEYKIYKVEDLEGSVVRFHKTLNGLAYFGTDFHPYSRCKICRRNSRGCLRVRNDIQKLMDENTITVLANREDDEVFTVSPQINQVEPVQVKYDSRKTSIAPLVIYLPGPVPYESSKATFFENGK